MLRSNVLSRWKICAVWLLLVGLVPSNLVLGGPARAAEADVILAASDPAKNQALYIPAENYPRPQPHGPENPYVNWPRHNPADGCPTVSSSDYKAIPFVPFTEVLGMRDSGDYVNASGNCSSQYVDAGTSSVPSWGGPPGAWISPLAYGNWTQVGSGIGFGQAYQTQGDMRDARIPGWGNNFGGIWGRPNQDNTDKARIMFANNNMTYRGSLCLRSHGTTLFRNEFTVTKKQMADLESGAWNPYLDILADDWFSAYVNGVPAASVIYTVDRRVMPVGNYFHEGVNIIAIQVLDKYAWLYCNTPAREAGLFYQLLLRNDGTPKTPTPTPPTRYPGVVGENSDVHAGGGICDKALSDGFVKGRNTAQSYGQYVVSAGGGGIGGFGSNGSYYATDLNLGLNGSYSRVCRPDLYKAATTYYSSGARDFTEFDGTDFDVSGKSGIYYLNAATTRLRGTISGELTLVARGNIIIADNMKLDTTPRDKDNAASLGVIAAGDIGINAGVTRVDAYLFANGAIDTCILNTGNCASGTLVVNGFLMAHSIMFHRLGPAGAKNAQLAERIVMNPQLYLNPPQFFDTSADKAVLHGQGERRPLF